MKLRSGDIAPFSYGLTKDQRFYSFESQAGRSAVVILAGKLPLTALAPLIECFERRALDFAACEADILVLVDALGPCAKDYVAAPTRGAQHVYCLPEIFDRWGSDVCTPMVVVTDRSMRVNVVIDQDSDAAIVDAAFACVATEPVETPRAILLPAPVLLVTNIFGADFCGALIDHFESNVHAVGGMASVDAFGNEIHKIDESKKKRADYVLPSDGPLGVEVLQALSRVCLPEIKKAFQADICNADRILIARYDESGGYFLRHRDNAAESVSFRQFAISVNLNSDDYEGGHLLFPEYNPHRYKPGRGAGIIFSASLLHEATPVTKGRRYVLLTFLHNAEGEARKLAILQKRKVEGREFAEA